MRQSFFLPGHWRTHQNAGRFLSLALYEVIKLNSGVDQSRRLEPFCSNGFQPVDEETHTFTPECRRHDPYPKIITDEGVSLKVYTAFKTGYTILNVFSLNSTEYTVTELSL